jgi:hypothetical protein
MQETGRRRPLGGVKRRSCRGPPTSASPRAAFEGGLRRIRLCRATRSQWRRHGRAVDVMMRVEIGLSLCERGRRRTAPAMRRQALRGRARTDFCWSPPPVGRERVQAPVTSRSYLLAPPPAAPCANGALIRQRRAGVLRRLASSPDVAAFARAGFEGASAMSLSSALAMRRGGAPPPRWRPHPHWRRRSADAWRSPRRRTAPAA